MTTDNTPITLYTGRGGVKDFIKAWCKELGKEYNWKNFCTEYKALRKAGMIQIHYHEKD